MKQKHYSTLYEIDLDILKARRRMKSLSLQVEFNEKEIQKHWDAANAPGDASDGTRQWHRDHADELKKKTELIKRRIVSVEDNLLPCLGRTRSALLTGTFAFVEDKSVVKQ